mmetsp:Transcript_12322/g.18917  ORF Transcript_12322/g.18917 Transcript_12322/m.18917 type:complete len:389 (-) Transcript_12322:61-1227(-)
MFFNTYGTHYVRSAKFGGSYELLVIADACAVVLSKEQGSNLAECTKSKLAITFLDQLGIDGDLASSNACSGFTLSGSASDTWKSSSIKTQQRWLGGSLDEADELQFDDIATWIKDIKQFPRSFPTQLAAITDLFRDLHGAYNLLEQYCLACQTLKTLGLTKETVGVLVRNLDHAFDDLLQQTRNETLKVDGSCSLKCGRCGKDPPESEECTCPDPDIADCVNIEGDDRLQVRISSIMAEVDKKWNEHLTSYEYQISTIGLGSPYDAKSYYDLKAPISATFHRRLEEKLYIEVFTMSLGKLCVGSAYYPFYWVGSGKKMELNGDCHDVNEIWGRIGENAAIWIDGSVDFAGCCSCTLPPIPESSSKVCSVTTSLLIALLALLVVQFVRH